MSDKKKVEHLYEVIDLVKFRETPGVRFDILPDKVLDKTAGVDRVIHDGNALSPGPIGDVDRPWYMHTHQSDHLIVLHGKRYVDLYSKKHGKIEHFIVEPNKIYRNGELICDHPAILSWPTHVFHRVESKEEGSASINFAYRDEGIDFDTNFNIHSLDPDTGEYEVIREAHEDQFFNK